MSDPAARRAWRQSLALSGIALALFTGVRWLPLSAGSLHYTDFNAGGHAFLEFCEPGSPQFAPVDRVRSPVAFTLEPQGALEPGRPVTVVARLTTAGGKLITGPELLVAHTEKLHVLIIDESLDDYQHVHPQPGRQAGTFEFSFTPQRAGRYRLFADFTPRATGRALYAGASLDVGRAGTTAGVPARRELATEAHRAGLRFHLGIDETPVRINRNAGMELVIARDDGRPLVLEPVMDAPAHLVAFDERISGFAHLHPVPASAGEPERLRFSLNVPDPGFYKVWAQVKVDGREIFAPFGIEAQP